MRPEIKEFMEALKAKTVGESEFHQAVEEVIETVWDTYQANPKYKENIGILVRCTRMPIFSPTTCIAWG